MKQSEALKSSKLRVSFEIQPYRIYIDIDLSVGGSASANEVGWPQSYAGGAGLWIDPNKYFVSKTKDQTTKQQKPGSCAAARKKNKEKKQTLFLNFCFFFFYGKIKNKKKIFFEFF